MIKEHVAHTDNVQRALDRFSSSSATKPQKAHVVRGVRKRKTNSRGIEATEKNLDSTHVPVSAGSESSLSELDSLS